jgi:hypothetical protein
MPIDDDEEKLLRSVALQNAKSIFLARQRAEREKTFHERRSVGTQETKN